jgi:thiol-disulfide isomerase/thioredoxin
MNRIYTLMIAALLLLSSPSFAEKDAKPSKQAAGHSLLEQKPMERFETSAPKALPEIQFFDEVGKPHLFEEFYGKVVLLNFWATWCAPCIKEMPDLSKLQKDFKRKNFKIIAISEDFKGAEEIRAFYKTNELTNLGIYMDKKNALFKELGIVGLPTTIIIDSEGKEVARAMGYIDWENSDLRSFIDKLTDGKTYAPEQITLQPAPTTAAPVAPVTPTAPAAQTTAPPAASQPPAPAAATPPVKAAPTKAAASRADLPPEAITTVPPGSLTVGQPSTVEKISPTSPQYNVRRPVNQPVTNPVGTRKAVDVNTPQ